MTEHAFGLASRCVRHVAPRVSVHIRKCPPHQCCPYLVHHIAETLRALRVYSAHNLYRYNIHLVNIHTNTDKKKRVVNDGNQRRTAIIKQRKPKLSHYVPSSLCTGALETSTTYTYISMLCLHIAYIGLCLITHER